MKVVIRLVTAVDGISTSTGRRAARHQYDEKHQHQHHHGQEIGATVAATREDSAARTPHRSLV